MRTLVVASVLSLSALAVLVGDACAAVRVLVTNEKSDDLTVIDAASGTVVKTIKMGKRPRGITISPDGKRVYVSNSNSDNVAEIDPGTLEVLRTAPAGRDPEGLTPSKDGKVLYVVNENDLSPTCDTCSTVTLLALPSLEIVGKLEVGLEPETAVLSPDGRFVTVSHESSNDIHVIDTTSNKVIKKIPVPKNPRGMRFTPDSGRLLVACEGADQISVIDTRQWKVDRSVGTGGERPVDISITADGKHAYVSHGRSNDVRVFDMDTLTLVTTIPVGPRAWWTALSPDGGQLYVTVGRANELVVIDTKTNKVARRIKAGELPWGVAVVEVP